MEAIVQYIPVVISIILFLVLVLMVVTNIVTEVLKGLVWQKLPINILAFLVAMTVTLLVYDCRRGGTGHLRRLCGDVWLRQI